MIITKDILKEKVPVNMIPNRLDSALNLYTCFDVNGEYGLFLYNTNPDTWNTLYSFYECHQKFTIDNYHFDVIEPTYQDLIDIYMREYKKMYEEEKGYTKGKREEVLKSEYIKTFDLNDVHIGDELTAFFELKYSKSKNTWTLYYFENYVANRVDSIDNLMGQSVYEQKFVPLNTREEEIEGTAIASNILYLLSIDDNVDKLKANKLN